MPFSDYQLRVKWDGVNWIDEPFKEGRIERGRDADLASVTSGKLNVWLPDTTARYNPTNPASPIYPYIARPLREVSLRATLNAVTYDLFTGYTRRHESDPSRTGLEGRLQCEDAFLLLGRSSPTIASVDTTTGGAIGLILDSIGFPDGASRALDTGDALTFSADGSMSGLQLIGDLLVTERGFFFIGAGGVATYLARYAAYRSPYTTSQSTIADTMQYLTPSVDLDQIRNRATVTKTGGVPQTYTDAASVALYNYSDYGAITSPYLLDENQALALATHLVEGAKDPTPPIRNLDLNNGKVVPFTALLARELGDHVTVSDTLGGTSGHYLVQRITHEFNASTRLHSGTWGLKQRGTLTPFILDVSYLDGPDLLLY